MSDRHFSPKSTNGVRAIEVFSEEKLPAVHVTKSNESNHRSRSSNSLRKRIAEMFRGPRCSYCWMEVRQAAMSKKRQPHTVPQCDCNRRSVYRGSGEHSTQHLALYPGRMKSATDECCHTCASRLTRWTRSKCNSGSWKIRLMFSRTSSDAFSIKSTCCALATPSCTSF